MGLIKRLLLFVVVLGASQASGQFTSTRKIFIPGGSFKMPAVLNKEKIRVQEFYLDEHPVTNEQYVAFTTQNPVWKKSNVRKVFADADYLAYWTSDDSFAEKAGRNAPVVQVSWFAAQAYCEWRGMRLPSINEWEYVASSFERSSQVQSVILKWYTQDGNLLPSSVLKTPKSLQGVYDLHGLIWEWVDDFNSSLITGESRENGSLDNKLFCGAGASKATDPSDYAAFMRYAFRSSLKASYTIKSLGFRCAQKKRSL